MGILIVAISIILCILIGQITYRKRMLTLDGSVTASVFGILIALTHPSWLVLLFGFLIAGVLVTRYRFSEKEEKGVQEGRKGERGYMNVLSTGLVPVSISLLSNPYSPTILPEMSGLLFLTAIATAVSDTVASEMGVLSRNTRLITTMKHVKPGTNGGVSPYGTVWSILGAAGTAVAGGLFLIYFSDTFPESAYHIFLAGVLGFTGCIFDSILGATLENRGYIGKGSVNFLSEFMTVALAFLLV